MLTSATPQQRKGSPIWRNAQVPSQNITERLKGIISEIRLQVPFAFAISSWPQEDLGQVLRGSWLRSFSELFRTMSSFGEVIQVLLVGKGTRSSELRVYPRKATKGIVPGWLRAKSKGFLPLNDFLTTRGAEKKLIRKQGSNPFPPTSGVR